MVKSSQRDTFVLGALGLGLFLVAWQVMGSLRLAGSTLPPLTDVLLFAAEEPRRSLLLRASMASLGMVALGYSCGVLLGAATGLLVHALPPFRPGLDRLASVIQAVPPIALAPVLIVLVNRDHTGMVIATINVFFPVYVAVTSGLSTTEKQHQQLFSVLGAKTGIRLRLLELPNALPSLASSMKFAVPAAFIGVILGEWFGASRGLGLLIVSAMQNVQILLLWSAVLVTATCSLVAYSLMSVLERAVHKRFTL